MMTYESLVVEILIIYYRILTGISGHNGQPHDESALWHISVSHQRQKINRSRFLLMINTYL